MKHEETEQIFPEVRGRAVRMVLEHRSEYPSLEATIESIAPKIGCVPQTLNEWVCKHEVDTERVTVLPTPSVNASRSLSGRTGSCAAPMRF